MFASSDSSPRSSLSTKGVLYTLVDQDDATRSKAYFYRDDQKIFEVTQDAAHKWTVLGAEL